MVGLDVTHQCHMTTAQIEGLEGRGRHGSFLRSIAQFYLDYHRRVLFVCPVVCFPSFAFGRGSFLRATHHTRVPGLPAASVTSALV